MVLLQLPNAGDELRAEEGVVELADIIVVSRATSTRSAPHRRNAC
jgi:putative protein kinase ArgK-like GTPase of G3E family